MSAKSAETGDSLASADPGSVSSIGDVANSKHPLLIIPKVQLRLRFTRRSWQKLFVGKNLVKILVTAQTQLRSYSEQQRAFGNSNICNWKDTQDSLVSDWVGIIKVRI